MLRLAMYLQGCFHGSFYSVGLHRDFGEEVAVPKATRKDSSSIGFNGSEQAKEVKAGKNLTSTSIQKVGDAAVAEAISLAAGNILNKIQWLGQGMDLFQYTRPPALLNPRECSLSNCLLRSSRPPVIKPASVAS